MSDKAGTETGHYNEVDMSPDKRKMRPMGIADILDETVELYKTSFVLLVGIAAFIHVPYSILERYFMMQQVMTVTAASTAHHEPSMNAVFMMLGTALIAYGYLLVTAPIVTGALTYAISERYLDRKVTILDSFKRVLSWSIFGQLLLAIIIKTAVVAVPLVLIMVAIMVVGFATAMSGAGLILIPVLILFGLAGGCAAFYLMLRLALLEVSIVVERKGIGHAVTRAWTMMPGNMVKCFLLYLIAWVVTGVVTWVCTSPTQGIIMANAATGGHASQAVLILHTVIGAISSTALAPVLSIVTILLYYDIRIRKEGFDLELLASELDARTAAWSAPALPQEQPIAQPAPEQSPPDAESSP